MTRQTPTPRSKAEILKGMQFEQITGEAGCKSALFLRKETGGGEPTTSLADSSTGDIITITSAHWLEFCEAIRSGKIT